MTSSQQEATPTPARRTEPSSVVQRRRASGTRRQAQTPAVAVVRAAAGDAATRHARRVAARARLHRRRRRRVHLDDAQARAAGRVRPPPRLARDQAVDLVRLPGDRADVRARRPVLRPSAPTRPRQDRHGAVPGDRDRARVRARQRRSPLELRPVLRLADLRHDLHRLPARTAHAGDRLAARAGRLPPAGAAGRLGQAHRGGRARAGRTARAWPSISSATSR